MGYKLCVLISFFYVAFICLSGDLSLRMKKVGIGFGSKRRVKPSEASERQRALDLRHSKYVTID